MIKEYRNHQRISRAITAISSSHSAFVTFQGESLNDDSGKGRVKKWDKCLCGKAHSFKECPYLIEGLRTADWSLNADIEKEIDYKLANIPKLKTAVDRAQREMKERLSLKKKLPEKPQEKNDTPRTSGSFAVAAF
jgi:hypothetical protein